MSEMTEELAAEIRRVDGSHGMGAGALAEALEPWIAARLRGEAAQAEQQAVAVHLLRGGDGSWTEQSKAAHDWWEGRPHAPERRVLYTRPHAALSSTAAPAIGDPINADSDADYLRKLGDRIGGDCGAVLHGIAVGLDAPAPVTGDRSDALDAAEEDAALEGGAPVAGDAVRRLVAEWRSYKGSIYADNSIKQDALADCADELEAALAQGRAAQEASNVG